MRIKRKRRIPHRRSWPAALLLAVLACDKGDEPPSVEESAVNDKPLSTLLIPEEVTEPDPAEAPGALVDLHQTGGWLKLEPVRVANSDSLDQIIPDAAMCSVMKTYRIRKAARCAYRNEKIRATVLHVETEGTDDAFGLYSIFSPQTGQVIRRDGSMRAVQSSPDAQRFTGWRGAQYVEILVTDDSPERPTSEQRLDELLDRILLGSPAADPPLLWRTIVRDKQSQCRLWVVRSGAALNLAEDSRIREIDARQIDARMALNGEALLAVAAVPMAGGGLTNLIWLVEYPNAAAAAKVFAEYQHTLQAPANRLDSQTSVEPPSGPYLFGTWSKGEESIQPMLPVLRLVLSSTSSQPP